MEITYLATENDDVIHNRESSFWASRNISSLRVSTMSEGIKEAINSQFLYIGINADNINYRPQLPLLRESANDPIFISTSNYTMQEQWEAITLGADLFGQISKNPDDNFHNVMANINALQERTQQRRPRVKLLFYGNVLMSPKYRKVFVDDKEIELTKLDFDLLYYLIINRGIALSTEQIHSQVWKNERTELIDNVVMCAIKRLRKKIAGQNTYNCIIENVWGIGYRLSLN